MIYNRARILYITVYDYMKRNRSDFYLSPIHVHFIHIFPTFSVGTGLSVRGLRSLGEASASECSECGEYEILVMQHLTDTVEIFFITFTAGNK